MTTALERIAAILQHELDADGPITAETTLADLGADSLDKVTCIMAVEEEFRIDIPDGEAETVQTIGDIVTLADRLVATSVQHR